MMKSRSLIAVLLIGIVFSIAGGLFKVMHWSGASIALITGAFIKVIALIWLIIKLFNNGTDQ